MRRRSGGVATFVRAGSHLAGTLWGRAVADVAMAWSHKPVREGFYGTILLHLGSLTPAYLPQNSPWWVPMRAMGLDSDPARYAGTICVIAGVALLMDAWFKLRPWAYEVGRHWVILVVWSAPLLFAPPIFSHDAYSYAAQGWLVHNGLNPYQVGPGVLPGAFADQVSWVWRYTPAPYGPLSMQLSRGLIEMVGLNPYYSALSMRIPAVVGVAMIVLLLPRIAHQLGVNAQVTAWFATLNPLLVIDFVGGAHNDALMMGLVVLALWLAKRPTLATGWRRWWAVLIWPAIIIGVAAAIKQPAFLAAYPIALLARPWRTWHARDVLGAAGIVGASFAVAIGTFAAISVATGLYFGWMNAVGVPGSVLSLAPFTLVGMGLDALLALAGANTNGHAALDVARVLGLAVTGISITWLALTVARRKPVTFLSWAYLIAAICGPALHSWYLMWGGLLIPLTRPTPRMIRTAVVVTIVLLAYGAGNLAVRNDAWALGLAGLGMFAALAVQHFRHRRGHFGSEGVSRIEDEA